MNNEYTQALACLIWAGRAMVVNVAGSEDLDYKKSLTLLRLNGDAVPELGCLSFEYLPQSGYPNRLTAPRA